jgi:hypothetical protein
MAAITAGMIVRLVSACLIRPYVSGVEVVAMEGMLTADGPL